MGQLNILLGDYLCYSGGGIVLIWSCSFLASLPTFRAVVGVRLLLDECFDADGWFLPLILADHWTGWYLAPSRAA